MIAGHGIVEDGEKLIWTSGLQIDADGSPFAYNQDDTGLDYLANAKNTNGQWVGVVTTSTGVPVIQRISDPAPGYYVSQTALQDSRYPVTDPRRYVNSDVVPYLSIPPELMQEYGVRMTDVAYVTNLANGSGCAVIVCERGPHRKIGEGSIALARALGINPSPKNGGVDSGVQYTLWRNSGRGWPRDLADIAKQVDDLRLAA